MSVVKWRYVRFDQPLLNKKLLTVNLNEIRPTVRVSVMDPKKKNDEFTHWLHLDDLPLPEWPTITDRPIEDCSKKFDELSTKINEIYLQLIDIKKSIS